MVLYCTYNNLLLTYQKKDTITIRPHIHTCVPEREKTAERTEREVSDGGGKGTPLRLCDIDPPRAARYLHPGSIAACLGLLALGRIHSAKTPRYRDRAWGRARRRRAPTNARRGHLGDGVGRTRANKARGGSDGRTVVQKGQTRYASAIKSREQNRFGRGVICRRREKTFAFAAKPRPSIGKRTLLGTSGHSIVGVPSVVEVKWGLVEIWAGGGWRVRCL